MCNSHVLREIRFQRCRFVESVVELRHFYLKKKVWPMSIENKVVDSKLWNFH